MNGTRLTRRGRAVLNLAAMSAFLLILGLAGWVEAGM